MENTIDKATAARLNKIIGSMPYGLNAWRSYDLSGRQTGWNDVHQGEDGDYPLGPFLDGLETLRARLAAHAEDDSKRDAEISELRRQREAVRLYLFGVINAEQDAANVAEILADTEPG